ncbi:helix-turn-helix domain-containing protein [Neobacillus cucumis]|nr:helix-turn-helix domain-containing protein [Neobacillus cucumis]
MNRFFLNYSTQEIINFTEEIFSRLRTDKAQTHELEKTLTIYIASNKSAKEAAEKLNIHINTLFNG